MPALTREELEQQTKNLCQQGCYQEATRLALSGYGPEIFGWLVGIVREGAEDIFQLFSVALWRGFSGFRWESSLRVWAYQIARREMVRFQVAKDRRREERLPTAELLEIAQEVTSLHGVLYKHQQSDRLQLLRQELPEEMQTILILRVDREMSFGEIGQVLEIEEEAARQKFKRAKDKLKELARREGLLS